MAKHAAKAAVDVQEKESRPPDVVLASILTSLRAADSTREKSELIRESLHAMARTVTAVVMFTLLLCIALLELTIGATKWDSCPLNPCIPLWLVVSGTLGLIRNIFGIVFSVVAPFVPTCRHFIRVFFIRTWLLFFQDDRTGRIAAVREILMGVFATFWVVWLIVGSYWTYGAYNDVVYEQGDRMYCDQLAYLSAFAIITLTYVITGLLLCCCCYCIVCLCCYNGSVVVIT